MLPSIEVLFAPAEFAALPARDLSQTLCVVFDVLRATSTIVTALANGAAAVIPVAEISDCLALRRERREVLLAGERQGLRIRADLAEGVDFDFGNSPREFTREKVQGRTIALTTTNGSRALRACAHAQTVLASSFLNLRATADYVRSQSAKKLLLICAGTFDEAALEDLLGAGALSDLLIPTGSIENCSDSTIMALDLYQNNRANLANAIGNSRNGRRLLSQPELRDDVAWCLRQDAFPLVAKLNGNALVKN